MALIKRCGIPHVVLHRHSRCVHASTPRVLLLTCRPGGRLADNRNMPERKRPGARTLIVCGTAAAAALSVGALVATARLRPERIDGRTHRVVRHLDAQCDGTCLSREPILVALPNLARTLQQVHFGLDAPIPYHTGIGLR